MQESYSTKIILESELYYQDLIAGDMNTNIDKRTSPAYVQVKMNSFGEDRYECYNRTVYTVESQMMLLIKDALKDSRCPIVCLEDTSGLDYYGGKSYGHYITIYEVNDLTKTIMITDPFNDDLMRHDDVDALFGGRHSISYYELFDALGYSDGWVIC